MERTVLITGCSSGIGYASAMALREQGYRVIASARKPADIEMLRQQGLTTIELDLTCESSMERAAAQALELGQGRVYGLFNNGAYGQPGALEDLPTSALRRQFETNLFGLHHLTRLLLPSMLEAKEGRIIQNSSVLGLVAMKYRGAYNASKFALEGYTDTLRQELKGSGVCVSLIEPGPIDTAFRKNARAAFLQEICMDESRHQDAYQLTLQRLDKEGPSGRFTLPADACVKPLLHALNSRSPKARYAVTVPTHLMGFFRRVLPTSLLDRLLANSA
ncbi:SDR family oxidoreductase [Dongshaea marina]|uniref:SDR family oxidoreductase n=1 Tax=Dongshaea marina TaxID=2047966 RepID=UPI000D3E6387|nr:SDR family oxidoreductase [Dongshaea marina]